MEKILEQSLFFDFYGELLTPHQKAIYEDFVLNDLSLSEIAQDQQISRQGVYDIIKRCNKQLEGYEAKLHLVDKFLKAKHKIKDIHQLAEAMTTHDLDEQFRMDCIRKIERLSIEILDEF